MSHSSRIDAYFAFTEALTEALDVREHKTGEHSKRTACHTLVLAQRFFGDPDALRQIYWGALLHDVGKIGVPDAILLKDGPLTDAEWRVMKTHPEKGYHIISQVPGMEMAAEIILCHEEHFDGSGYPRGLKEEEIPLGARLLAVVDTLDAMVFERSYRQGVGFDEAMDEIEHLAGTQLDPLAVRAFQAEAPTLRDMVLQKHRPWPEIYEMIRNAL